MYKVLIMGQNPLCKITQGLNVKSRIQNKEKKPINIYGGYLGSKKRKGNLKGFIFQNFTLQLLF